MHMRSETAVMLGLGLLWVGCSSSSGSTRSPSTSSVNASATTFVSSWTSPTAKPLRVQGAKVAAVVILSDLPSRRTAEDRLAAAISESGGVGLPMYRLVEQTNVESEPIARDALQRADVQGVVVLHPGPEETEAAPQDYTKAPYSSYWDGYYIYGYGTAWDAQPAYQSFVSVETLIYSLVQNQLVWAGRSKTTNPASLGDLINEVATATATELGRASLLVN